MDCPWRNICPSRWKSERGTSCQDDCEQYEDWADGEGTSCQGALTRDRART